MSNEHSSSPAPEVHTDGMTGIGPLIVTAEDGAIHISWSDGSLVLDRPAADDLIHLLVEAQS